MNILFLVSIALLTPVTHPSLEQIEKGFKETLPSEYRIDTYNAQGNKTLMRSELEEIVRGDYDLLFTIGTTASQMATEVFAKKGIALPIVFTCVNDPEGFRISGNNVTGVQEMLNFREELAALLKYKPTIKKVLLVYNPAEPGLQKDQREVEKILKEHEIGLSTVETFQTNEIKAKVTPFLGEADAVIVLKDNTVVSGLDALIKLCDKHRIPLMASDLDSPSKGAAFGYGVHEREFGVEGAKKALQILKEKIAPHEIPVTPLGNFSLKINEEAAKRQGITCLSP
jgi:putative ABC transport system substrate-binding protein